MYHVVLLTRSKSTVIVIRSLHFLSHSFIIIHVIQIGGSKFVTLVYYFIFSSVKVFYRLLMLIFTDIPNSHWWLANGFGSSGLQDQVECIPAGVVADSIQHLCQCLVEHSFL